MDYEFRRNGQVIGEVDFGRVLAGSGADPVTVQLVNTSGHDWLTTNVSLAQGDSDGGYATLTVAGLDQDSTPRDAGPVPDGGALELVLGWITPLGTVGRAGDFASITVDYTY